MSAPVTLCALPEYEPERRSTPVDPDEVGFPEPWSSLRPPRGPQLTIEIADPAGQELPTGTLRRMLSTMLEVLDGRRQVGQLRTLLAGPVYEAMLTRLRTSRPGRHHRLRRVHTCRPTEDAIELTAIIEVTATRAFRRVLAAAIRLEHRHGTWTCTVLRFL